MQIYYATSNPGKVRSLQREFANTKIEIIQCELEIPEIRSSHVEKIARAKVISAYDRLKKPILALDAGFYIDILNGFPRAYVNFALNTIGLDGILKLVEGKDRNCFFRESLAYIDFSLEEPLSFQADVKGTLADQTRGTLQKHLWSKLGFIFIPEGSQKTLAEMSYDEHLEWRKISREQSSASGLFFNWFVTNKGK